jgi:phosphoribosyl 1,2-cyclic phosphodiesterase
MEATFFGTRGSLPVPGPRTVKYGGNTSCTAVTSSQGTLVVLDMGTGSFALGQALAATGKPIKGHVLISHTHWDHIQGLPFFAPFFRAGNEWDVYAPRGLSGSLRETLSGQMQYTYFPLELEQLGATIRYHDLVEGALTLEDIAVRAQYLNHPAMTLGYRLEADGETIVYALDHEPFDPALAGGTGNIVDLDRRHVDFLKDADLVIHDAQYLANEFAAKVGWGHSTVEYALHVAHTAGVRRLALAHHDPNRCDEALDELVEHFKSQSSGVELLAAAEGTTVTFSELEHSPASKPDADHGSPIASSTQATTQPALSEQWVLLTVGDAALTERLTRILRSDHITVVSCAPHEIEEAVKTQKPSLVVIAAGENAGEALSRVKSIRRLAEPLGSLPIVLAGQRERQHGDEVPGITDRLALPFTDNYARTRLRAWLMRRACKWALPPVPLDEADRLAALHALNILDTPPDALLDSLVKLATDLFNVPIAAVTLVDRDRQWFKASRGLGERETPRDESFCAHVVADSATMLVPDAHLDSRFAENPGVSGAPHVRFYAGQPIILSEGQCIGTLCIADVRPRALSESELARLAKIAEIVLKAIEAPRASPE